jgi:mannose-6-phosphate isomerase-like protein (cupin superfamily)
LKSNNLHKPVHVKKSWGYEEWIHNDEKYCGKKLYVEAGKKCSFHFHVKKHETFHVASGKCYMRIIRDDMCESFLMEAGDNLEVSPGLVHQFTATEDGPCVIYEFSTQHFNSDSYRIEPGTPWPE